MKLFKVRPVFAVPGVLLIGVGIWLIYKPAAYIFGGLCLCALSAIQGKPETPKNNEV